MRSVIEGIEKRGVFRNCVAVVSGYIGGGALGDAVLDAVARVRAANPDALFLCDPVMGDVGVGLYVDRDVVSVMGGNLVPAADLITPNQFEVEQITGRRIDSMDDALAAAHAAMDLGPEAVLITSLRLESSPDDAIEMLAVGRDSAYRVRTPYLAMEPMIHGSGDATAALFLGHCLRAGAKRGTLAAVLGTALGEAAAAIFAIMAASQQAADGELAVVAAQDRIATPDRRFEVERLE